MIMRVSLEEAEKKKVESAKQIRFKCISEIDELLKFQVLAITETVYIYRRERRRVPGPRGKGEPKETECCLRPH